MEIELIPSSLPEHPFLPQLQSYLNESLSLFNVKDKVCQLFENLLDKVQSMISEFEIQIMSQIYIFESRIQNDEELLFCKQEVKKQNPYFCFNPVSFVKTHMPTFESRILNNSETILINTKQIAEQIIQQTNEVLSNIDISQVCSNLVKSEFDVKKFSGVISSVINDVNEVYSICKLTESSIALTSTPNQLIIYKFNLSEKQETFHLLQSFECKNLQPRVISRINGGQLSSSTKFVVGTQEGSILLFQFTKDLLFHTSTISQQLLLWDICKLSSNSFASVSFCGSLQIWNYSSKKLIKERRSESQCLVSVRSISNQYLCVASNKIQLLLRSDLREKAVYENPEMGFIFALEKIDNRRVAFGATDGILRIWNHKLNILEHVLDGHTKSIYAIRKINRNHILSCAADGKIRIWKTEHARPGICVFKSIAHEQSTFALAVLDNIILTAGKDTQIKVWR